MSVSVTNWVMLLSVQNLKIIGLSSKVASVTHVEMKIFTDFVHDGLKRMRAKMKDMAEKGVRGLEDERIEEMFGPKIVEDVSIYLSNQRNNRGCRKRIIGAAEKSLGGKRTQKGECKTYKELAFHDSRNRPTKH